MSDPEKNFNQNSEPKLDKQQSNEDDLEKVAGDLESLPPEVKNKFLKASLLQVQGFSSRSVSPIAEKINEDHITKILEIVEKDDDRAFADLQSSRKYALVNTIIFVVTFGILTFFLVNKDVGLYQEILKIIIIFGGGFGSGLGFKSYQDRKRK